MTTFWLFVAVLVVGYFLFKANEERVGKSHNRGNQKRHNTTSVAFDDSRNRANTARKPSNLKRPYIKCYFTELERIADAEWNNIEVLRKIHYELQFRSRKKAKVLRSRLHDRLSVLEND